MTQDKLIKAIEDGDLSNLHSVDKAASLVLLANLKSAIAENIYNKLIKRYITHDYDIVIIPEKILILGLCSSELALSKRRQVLHYLEQIDPDYWKLISKEDLEQFCWQNIYEKPDLELLHNTDFFLRGYGT